MKCSECGKGQTWLLKLEIISTDENDGLTIRLCMDCVIKSNLFDWIQKTVKETKDAQL